MLPKFTWDVDPIALRYPEGLPLPGDGLRYYSILYIIVFIVGYRLWDWQVRRAGGSERESADFFLYALFAVVAGSHLGDVLFYDPGLVRQDPAILVEPWRGGLSSHGGAIGLLIAIWFYTRRKRQSFVECCDRLAFTAALGAALIRLGNFFNSEVVGRKTNQSWGVYMPRFDRAAWPIYRHPSQLYEFALGLLVLCALWATDERLGKEQRPRGVLTGLFFAMYFSGRFLVEYTKEAQSWARGMPLTEGQYLSILPAAIGFVGLWWSIRAAIPSEWHSDVALVRHD